MLCFQHADSYNKKSANASIRLNWTHHLFQHLHHFTSFSTPAAATTGWSEDRLFELPPPSFAPNESHHFTSHHHHHPFHLHLHPHPLLLLLLRAISLGNVSDSCRNTAELNRTSHNLLARSILLLLSPSLQLVRQLWYWYPLNAVQVG